MFSSIRPRFILCFRLIGGSCFNEGKHCYWWTLCGHKIRRKFLLSLVYGYLVRNWEASSCVWKRNMQPSYIQSSVRWNSQSSQCGAPVRFQLFFCFAKNYYFWPKMCLSNVSRWNYYPTLQRNKYWLVSPHVLLSKLQVWWDGKLDWGSCQS